MRSSADIVIIGGGILGTSIAYHLASMQAGRVLLLEREDLLGTGSTGRCAGGFRLQFSTEINIRMSLESVRMILAFEEDLDCPVDVHQDGYLFLLSRSDDLTSFRRNVALQNRLGVPAEILDPVQLGRLAPHVSLEGILAGAYCRSDGIADPNGITQGYAAAARRLGVEIRTGTTVKGIRVARNRIEGVETPGEFIACHGIVNAAGPHAAQVAALAGLDVPVHPQRRHVYTTSPFPEAPRDFLMVIDFATTFYFHRESGGVLMGMGDKEETESFDLSVDPQFLEKLLEIALPRYPALANTAINSAWAGLYAVTPDAHPILGRVDNLEGFFLANGFSGHGFQHGPVTGKLLAEEILLGGARTIDIAPLRLNRFKGKATPQETNVV